MSRVPLLSLIAVCCVALLALGCNPNGGNNAQPNGNGTNGNADGNNGTGEGGNSNNESTPTGKPIKIGVVLPMTGAIATYNYTDDLTLYGGWTLGWDTGFDQFNGGSSWLGGVGYALSDDVSLTYMSTYGDFGFLGNGRNDSYSHSVVVDFALTDNLNYVFQSDMIKADVYDTVGINQYLFYTLNDCAAVGTRIEWWKNDGVSYNAATFGLNYRPHANLVFRPEIKHEWVPGLDLDQTIFGIDMIVTY